VIRGVAVSGKAGSGKTELAGLLCDALRGYRLSFATAVKADCHRDWGITKEMPGGREALIHYGEEKRAEDSHYWVDRLYPSVEASWAEGRVPVIDDLRFPDEYDAVQDWGFATVRVKAPDSLRVARLEASGHDPAIVWNPTVTESALDTFQFDHVVSNMSTHMLLRSRALILAAWLLRAGIAPPCPLPNK
jgi:hypothetical protein